MLTSVNTRSVFLSGVKTKAWQIYIPTDILGTGYAFISSANPQAGWTISEKSVKNLTSIPGRILGPIYGEKSDKNLFHMFYNDAHPDDKTSFYLGHTKGVIVLKEKSGFWLVHSVPKFPPALGEAGEDEIYDYPHSGT